MAEEEIPIVTKDVFEDMVLKSTKPVVVFCYLQESGLCHIKLDDFKRAAKKNSGKVKFLRMDVGRSKDLAFEYRVMAVPSLLYVSQGKVIERRTGISYSDSIEAFVERTMGSKFDRLPEGIVHVTEENFEEIIAAHAKIFLLNFWKSDHEFSWQLLPELVDMADKYKEHVRIGVANFDESRDLSTRFRVFNVPTTVYFKKGEAVDRIVGIQPRITFEHLIRTVMEDR